MVTELEKRLREGTVRLIVWGGGDVGLSAAIAFAAEGTPSTIYDTDPDRVTAIMRGGVSLSGLEQWTGRPLAPLVSCGAISATHPPEEIPLGSVHVIAVPTELGGRPWDGAVRDVLSRLTSSKPTLCLVESTLTPGTCEAFHLEFPEVPLAIAPRRDWFLGYRRDLRSLPRVFAATSGEATSLARAVLSIVSDHLQEASAPSVAELTKCIENSLHHVSAMYATQLARAFPDWNVNEAFRLATGHWRINTTYFASAGTGGHCLSIATQHLLFSSHRRENLTICDQAQRFDQEQRVYVADLIEQWTSGPVGLIGLTYRGNVPLLRNSPFAEIGKILGTRGLPVLFHDSHCGPEAERDIPGGRSVALIDVLQRSRFILLGATHDEYRQLTIGFILSHLKRGTMILDNEGLWERFSSDLENAGVRYRRIGDAGWASPSPDIDHPS